MLNMMNMQKYNHVLLANATPVQEGPNLLVAILLMVGIFLIFYFLIVRPQQKRQNELKKEIEQLKKGDYVINSGGMKIEVVQVKEDTFIGKIDKDIKVEFQKWSITSIIK